ncbi:hypothetical protein BN59_03611 [Legionella massiliensis]|uniref:Uncharacterized protein n=1 Tax=Legionella massiliensis TaxID=1034943 RepID=A0A078L5S2_9GAMM|nr:hypothetical protein [Legionella massiliensis]CDZ79293.1 hypothetical protein BN59_03611 [Legionella massiliensis]CEE15031.1 hypothetical protein BN1094_03611 [Legionella massiliensis]
MSSSEIIVHKELSKKLKSTASSSSLFTQSTEGRIHNLQHQVAHGSQDRAKAVLSRCADLMFSKGNFSDNTNRKFFKASALQYAWWARDTSMLNMMWNCIVNDEQRIEMINQIKDVMINGLIYEYKGVEYQKTHYSLELYIRELEDFNSLFNIFKIENDELKQHRLDRIGQFQREFPAHVRQQYCSFYGAYLEWAVFSKELNRSLKIHSLNQVSLLEEVVDWDSDLDNFMQANNMLICWIANGTRRNLELIPIASKASSFDALDDSIQFVRLLDSEMSSSSRCFYEKIQQPFTLQIEESPQC